MCGRSKNDPKVLERRQNGLDARGNNPSKTPRRIRMGGADVQDHG